MRIIREQAALSDFAAECAEQDYVTVDTEFLRERTYWPQLCLVQVAYPGSDYNAALIDPLADGLDLAPLYELMADESVVKVFHAARQDVEIFHKFGGVIPTPLFDTQVAAMVCGYGEQVGYETLVRKIAREGLDKSSRFTDWSRRPLSEKQLVYALADVTHLRVIYEKLAEQLDRTGRSHWVKEELKILTDPGTYETDPPDAWKRIRTRTTNGKFLAVVRELAAWREAKAQERNVPRSRLLKDEALLEVASNKPKTVEELGRSRLLMREARKNDTAQEILAAVAAGEAVAREDQPFVAETPPPKPGSGALVDLLKVLLKARSDEMDVAQKLIASTEDLQRIANEDEPQVRAMHGWRNEVFGELAMRLKRGEIALSATPKGVKVVEL
jgi:ribonuclease D